MTPPIPTLLMQSRPLLDPDPRTIVASQILTNPLFYKCRISDHLHLVLQWQIHTGVLSKREVAVLENVYKPSAQARTKRKHEGHPARAPDGTIMEIEGEAYPGNTGESVGPWDFGNVHECNGYPEWSKLLSQTLDMALQDGVEKENINKPQPSREDLEKAQGTESFWKNGPPVPPSTRKALTTHRDGIRDKLYAFLTFVDVPIESESGREKLCNTLREDLGAALDGNEVAKYNGKLGGMINNIVDRIKAFMKYLDEHVEKSEEAKEQRIEEVREIVDGILDRKTKRKRDDQDEGDERARKKITTESNTKTEEELLAELYEYSRPRELERKPKRRSWLERAANRSKDEDSASERRKCENESHDGSRFEDKAAGEKLKASKDGRTQLSGSSENVGKISNLNGSCEAPTSSTTMDKAMNTEVEADTNGQGTALAASICHPARNNQTPPPPYSPQFSSSSRSSSRRSPRAQGSETVCATPSLSAPEQTIAVKSSPVSDIHDEFGPQKPMTEPALLLEKIHSLKQPRGNAVTENSHLASHSSPSSASTPTPQEEKVVGDLRGEDAAITMAQLSSSVMRSRQSSLQPETIYKVAEEHSEGEDCGSEEDEDSLFLPQKKSPRKRHQPPSKDEQDQEELCLVPAVEANEFNDLGSTFNTPSTPYRASSYDLELPPLPAATSADLHGLEDETSLFLPQIQTSRPTLSLEPAGIQSSSKPSTQTPTQTPRQSSYDLELPPPPRSRLGSSNMPIDIDFYSYSSPLLASSSSAFPLKHPSPYTSTSIFGGPASTRIKSESSSSPSSSFECIEIKDEGDGEQGPGSGRYGSGKKNNSSGYGYANGNPHANDIIDVDALGGVLRVKTEGPEAHMNSSHNRGYGTDQRKGSRISGLGDKVKKERRSGSGFDFDFGRCDEIVVLNSRREGAGVGVNGDDDDDDVDEGEVKMLSRDEWVAGVRSNKKNRKIET